MERSTIIEKRKIICEFIRNNPDCTCKQIKKATKLKIERVYPSLRDAYKEVGIDLPKSLTRRNRDKQINEVLNYIRKCPGCTIPEIRKSINVNVARLFKNIKSAYNLAGIDYPKREVTLGVADPEVVKRCLRFEKEIISLLSILGDVRPKVRCVSGIIDCLFHYNNQDYVVKVKDFRSRNNITMSQIKQLVRYLQELNIKKGIIVCPKESFPKRKNGRNLYIEDLKIMILSDEDLRGRSIKEI